MSLPILAYRDELIDLVLRHKVVVLTAETGSGKTTKIPQLLFDSPEIQKLCGSDEPRIVVVQPHRIAAIAVARRVAAERSVELGKLVGYTVRWDSLSDPHLTKIRYVTDGTLVKEFVDGRCLKQVDFVMIDEAHERSLHIDVLLALIRRHLKTQVNSPTRFVITSATLDTDKFCRFFDDCPLVTVPGKLFAVRCIHVPVKVSIGDDEEVPAEGGLVVPGEDGDRPSYNPGIQRRRRQELSQVWLSPDAAVTACVTISLKIHCETPIATGHILCFLSGASECERAVKLMHQKLQMVAEQAESGVGAAVAIPLYGSLDAQQQANVFVQVGPECRKIIFATNVAETSLTIPNVGHIVDSGIAKQTSYNARSGIMALNRVPISKTQARQRAGRAGRTKEGTCWRLYDEETFGQMQEHTVPEILRSDPSAAVLALLAMNIKNILSLEFVDTPNKLSIALALKELATLGAIYPDTLEVTRIGKAMCHTPLDPVYGRCFVASLEFDCVEEVAIILSLLSAEQVFTSPNLAVEHEDDRPPSLFDIFRNKHRQFRDFDSDHLTLLTIFYEWQKRRGGSDLRMMRKEDLYDWCWSNYLSMRAFMTAEKIQKQLIDLMPDIEQVLITGRFGSKKSNDTSSVTSEFPCNRYPNMRKKERILRCLCQGMFVNAAKLYANKSLRRNTVVVRGWSSAREGVVIKPAPQSTLSEFVESADYEMSAPPPKADPPAWIIYDQLISIGGGSSTAGVCRVASAVDYDWLQHLMPRLYQTSLDDLIQAVQAPTYNAKKRRQVDQVQEYYQQNKRPTMSTDNFVAESTRSERENKIAEAKRRLMERKQLSNG